MDQSYEDKLNALFEELVPRTGKAETLAGEIVRATSRIAYRLYNDGDQIGIGYGRETCNPAARFLHRFGGEKIASIVSNLWCMFYKPRYESMLNDELLPAVIELIEQHPEYRTTETIDLWDCRDKKEDVDRDDEDEIWEDD